MVGRKKMKMEGKANARCQTKAGWRQTEGGSRPEEATQLPDRVIAERRCQSAAEGERMNKRRQEKRGQFTSSHQQRKPGAQIKTRSGRRPAATTTGDNRSHHLVCGGKVNHDSHTQKLCGSTCSSNSSRNLQHSESSYFWKMKIPTTAAKEMRSANTHIRQYSSGL